MRVRAKPDAKMRPDSSNRDAVRVYVGISQIEHTRHRSPVTFLVNLVWTHCLLPSAQEAVLAGRYVILHRVCLTRTYIIIVPFVGGTLLSVWTSWTASTRLSFQMTTWELLCPRSG